MKTKLRYVIRHFGYTKSIIIVTILSILLSVGITHLVYNLRGINVPQVTLLISIIAPLIIAPFISSYLIKVVMELYTIESKLKELTTHDELTGLFTRRNFRELADSYYSLAKRNNYVFSVLLMDLDNFKKVNDTYGHLAGDEALRKISEVLNASMRSSDVIGRFGGEEFICLLPETNGENTHQLCRNLHEKINNTKITYDGHNFSLTISIGFTSYDSKDNNYSLDELIKQADQALYEAKNRRRNCTVQFRKKSGTRNDQNNMKI